MTLTPVNLRRYKKQKTRDEKERVAETNRIAFGRTKAEKAVTRTENERLARLHEQKRIDRLKPDDD